MDIALKITFASAREDGTEKTAPSVKKIYFFETNLFLKHFLFKTRLDTCDDHRGYPSDLIDRIYIGELLVKAGRSLRLLKAKLEYIQARLPPFDELTTCQRYQPLSPIVMQSTARQSIDFYKNLTFDFKPIIDEFAKCILDV